MKNKFSKYLILTYFIAVAGLFGCGNTDSTPVQTPAATAANQYKEIEYYNNLGLLMKDEFYGNNRYAIEYTYDDTRNVLNAKITGNNSGRTIYKLNCYYADNHLINKITYDNDGVITENINYTYKNGVLSKSDRTYYTADKGKCVEITDYDPSGKIVKITGDDWYTVYEDNTESTYKKIDGEYVLSDRIISEYEDGKIARETYLDKVVVYQYLDNGKTDRILTYIPDDEKEDNIKIGVVYEYDDRGYNSKIVTYRFFSSVTEVEFVVENTYDDHGNHVCQITNDKIDFLNEYVYYDNGKIKEIRHVI